MRSDDCPLSLSRRRRLLFLLLVIPPSFVNATFAAFYAPPEVCAAYDKRRVRFILLG